MLILVATAGSTKNIKAELKASGKEPSKEKIRMLMLVETAGLTKNINTELNASGKESRRDKMSYRLIITVNISSNRHVLV